MQLSRKAIITGPIALFLTFLISSIMLASSPLWVTALLIRPQLASPIISRITAKIMREVAKAMFSSGRKVSA